MAGVERVGRGVQEGGEVPARGGGVVVGSVGQRARQGRAGGASKIVFLFLSRVREFRGFFARFGGWAGVCFVLLFPRLLLGLGVLCMQGL